jgi:hypothetical protein
MNKVIEIYELCDGYVVVDLRDDISLHHDNALDVLDDVMEALALHEGDAGCDCGDDPTL